MLNSLTTYNTLAKRQNDEADNEIIKKAYLYIGNKNEKKATTKNKIQKQDNNISRNQLEECVSSAHKMRFTLAFVRENNNNSNFIAFGPSP